MKIKYDRTLEEQIIDGQKKKDKATTVFTKLYAKRRGKYKGWNSLGLRRLVQVISQLWRLDKGSRAPFSYLSKIIF